MSVEHENEESEEEARKRRLRQQQRASLDVRKLSAMQAIEFDSDSEEEVLNNQQTMKELLETIELEDFSIEFKDSSYWDAQEIEQRNEDIKFIASEMASLREVFEETNTEIHQQQEQMEQVFETTEEAKAIQKEATKTLGKSAKAASAVALPAGCGAVGGVIGSITGGIIGSLVIGGGAIPGVVIGAAVGAAGGAAVGAAGTTVLALATERQMHKARLSEQWQPDKYAKNCNACGKKFSQIVRKHHCRNCGLVFCSKCSKHKMTLPGVSTVLRPRVCNKCFDALMYFKQGLRPPSELQLLADGIVGHSSREEGGVGSQVPSEITDYSVEGPLPPPLPSSSSSLYYSAYPPAFNDSSLAMMDTQNHRPPPPIPPR